VPIPIILTPGKGPNGPGPIDMRAPVASVGTGSVPYGASDSLYVNPSGVKGFIGPSADALRRPTTWYVRTGGAITNGGSSVGLSADRTGTDGVTTANSRTFTSASAAFTPADVGKGICIQTTTRLYAKIESVTNTTTVVLTNPAATGQSSMTWAIGGAWSTPAPFLDGSSFALSTNGVQPGDTMYIGPGTYRVVYTFGTNWGAAYAAAANTIIRSHAGFNGRVRVIGDVTGQFTGDAAAPVILTAYTTNDKTAPSGTSLLSPGGQAGGAGGNNLSFYNIVWQGGNARMIAANSGLSQNIWFENCAFVGYPASAAPIIDIINSSSVSGALPMGWMIDRCRFLGTGTGAVINIVGTAVGSSDYNQFIEIRNVTIAAASASDIIAHNTTGTGSAKPGGTKIINVTCVSARIFCSATAQNSLAIPIKVYGCVLVGGSTVLSGGTTGTIIEDYNIIYSTSARSNVTAGTHSVSDGSYALGIHFGQEITWGGFTRPFAELVSGASALGFVVDTSLGINTYDMMNRPRPAGVTSLPNPSAGALERGNTWAKETGTVRTGANALSITGPGIQDFSLAVNAVPTTFTIYMRYNASYVGTKPRVQVLNGAECGVADATSSPVVSVNTWEQLTLSFTPTVAGIVTIRLVSSDQSGAGAAYADDYAVT